jgi:hypothetical protein
VVVVVESDGGGVVVVVVVVSFVFSVVGFTMVVLVSFFSAGEVVVGATTSVRCSQAPKSAALAKMQSNFFIVWIGLPHLGTKVNRMAATLRPCRSLTFAGTCRPRSSPELILILTFSLREKELVQRPAV